MTKYIVNKHRRPWTYLGPEDIYGKQSQGEDQQPKGPHAISVIEVHGSLNTLPS